ncbi:MAG TPA: DUF533 domain-containing protein [Burkholderiaceae bacterium]|nr:DUF533 domain-containing protein [Burkholderiaceae bacterium]
MPAGHDLQIGEARAVMALALLAALADGRNEDRERAELRRVADALGGELDVPALLSDVLVRRVSVSSLADELTTPETRRLAFELAVGVCDADGLRNEAETRFLAELGRQLGLDQPAIVETAVTADQLATTPLPAPVAAAASAPAAADLDRLILDAALLNGALELLPQTLATMAIVPLQLKLVHRIGRAYGVESDKLQIRELLATAGAGVTGQYLERIGRRLVSGLFGKGGIVAAVATGATGALFSFATTYAIGEVARRYYAGSRTMSTALLQQTFVELLQKGKALQAQYLPQIEEQARRLDPSKILQLLRDG